MSLRFVIGRSGSGKTTRFFNEMRDSLLIQPDGPPIIYLVPDQMTFLSEYRFIHTPGLAGVIRSQVLSFSRLAWRILQETGGAARNHITSIGLNMLIRKIIEDNKDDLKIFKQTSDKTGFIQHVESMLTEFKHYCVQPDDLALKQNELQFQTSTRTLADKLHDLELIFHKFEQSLIHKYIDQTDYLALLAKSIEDSNFLQDAEIYIDGFHSFTPQEYMVIEQLMKKCNRVSIALVLNRPYKFGEKPDELDLFKMTGDSYSKLYTIAQENNIDLEDDTFLSQTPRFQDYSLTYLEKKFEKRPIKPFEDISSIEMCVAANRRAEIEGIAREIRALVMKNEYRYKDIAILIRNGHEYEELIETVFSDHEIPYFIDRKLPMLNHPLIELIRSSLEVIATNWSYEPVFRAIKTDLLFPLDNDRDELREDMDKLENYVLANGIRGSRWTEKNKWTYKRYQGLEFENTPQTDDEIKIENKINQSRSLVALPLTRLARRLKRADNGRAFCESVYLMLEELDIPAKLEAKSQVAEEKGQLVVSREHDQAWDAVIELLDQFVEILGDEKLTIQQFIKVIDSGLEAMKFSLIPPAIDQVSIANLELSRLSNIKAAFVVGLNDGVLPAKIADDGVLSDEDRISLGALGLELAPDVRKKLLEEEFIAYRAFTVAEQRLYLSYPLANDEGKALLPSPYIKRLNEMFPNMLVKNIFNEPTELVQHEQFSYVSHPNTAIAFLTSQLQLKKRAYPVADFWWDVYNFYMGDPDWRPKAKTILSSLYYQNQSKKLTEKTSQALYGDQISASVSRMELFHSCPFSHFTSYGLKLRERDVFKLEAPHIGDLFHAALKWIADEISRQNLSWANLTKQQCEWLAKEAVAYLAPKLQNQILLSSNRHFYIKRKLEQVIGRATYALTHQAKSSAFKPFRLELAFGMAKEIPPLTFTLKNGATMQLQGRIDRVDKAEKDDGVYLRIIDYKSSSRALDLNEVYYGIALQMLTYLDIVITHSHKLIGMDATPAGVLYFHLHNPIIDSHTIMTVDDIEKEILKKFKMKGLLHGDPDIIRLMDTSLETGSSDIISASINKNGSLSARSKASSASEADFQMMRTFIRNLFQQSGDDIVSGKVDIDPYRLGNRTPCQFCSFKPVCQFDQTFENNQYRNIMQAGPDEIMAKMREGGMKVEN